MNKALEILQQYWKHDAFREPQEEIINSVLQGKDTFALMPTGGGKSICFQVPAMMQEGICLVISPLIALMRDQVENLQKKGIKAIALTGGIYHDTIIDLLDNCQFGNYKFLYLSPERLQNDWILERIKNLPINLIAIDEAHCVSQWGHDFRPAYLKIVQLKEYFPKVPFLALTASATLRVKEDIITQLKLDNPQVFTKSFYRANIAYMVFETEDKLHLLQQILQKNPQPSIIYVTNRKSCLETVHQLESHGFTATYYHGGLSSKEKEKHMKLWMEEKVQIIIATNAFGMGIDKANVKTAEGIGYACGFLIYFILLIYGSQVMMGVMEEKTNRIAEVIVSSVKPFQMMLGKILGIGMVALTQFFLWIAFVFIIYNVGKFSGAGGGMANQVVGNMQNMFASVDVPLILFCFGFYFLAGFFFYSSLYGAIGSAVNEDMREAQSLSFPITLLVILSIALMSAAISNPTSPIAVWASIIPFSSPIVMMARIPFGVPNTVPWWQLGLSMALLILGFIFTVWFAGKIYRTGILMYGKKPSWKEMMRWAFRKN